MSTLRENLDCFQEAIDAGQTDLALHIAAECVAARPGWATGFRERFASLRMLDHITHEFAQQLEAAIDPIVGMLLRLDAGERRKLWDMLEAEFGTDQQVAA
jgi:hypothetical protein